MNEHPAMAPAVSPFNSKILDGKVALITGGGSGIGLEIATQFGLHGAKVAIMGRRRHVLDEALNALSAKSIQAVGIEGDVRKTEDASRVVEETVANFGRLDILVNGAAGNFLVAAEDLSSNGFRTVMDIDTVGTFTMSRAAFPYLKFGSQGKSTSEGGVILNISATLQYTAAWYQIHVSAAKAAIDSMTRSLALEWGAEYGIRVNCIAPGPIEDTPGMEKLAPKEVTEGVNVKAVKWGEKWDIAMAAVYLASDAGRHVNGTLLPVDGGNWLFKPPYFPKEAIRSFSRVVEKRSRSNTLSSSSKL